MRARDFIVEVVKETGLQRKEKGHPENAQGIIMWAGLKIHNLRRDRKRSTNTGDVCKGYVIIDPSKKGWTRIKAQFKQGREKPSHSDYI